MPSPAEDAVRATIGEMAVRAHRETMRAGREKLARSAPLWRRVTDGDPCGFCAMVASRGPVYSSKSAAGADGNRYHGRCGCSVEPYFGDPNDWEPSPEERRFMEAYLDSYYTGIPTDVLADRIEAWLATHADEAADFLGIRVGDVGFDDFTREAVEHVTNLMASLQGDIRRDVAYAPLPAAEAARNKGLQGYWMASENRIAIRNAGDGAVGVLNTIVHESGHAMERMFGYRGSAAVNANRSVASPAWREWNKVIRRSDRFKELAAIKSSGGKYMRQNDELWARSYAQWVAVRTGDRRMLDEIAEMRKGEYGVRLQVWDDADFEPIAKAIDEVMKEFAP